MYMDINRIDCCCHLALDGRKWSRGHDIFGRNVFRAVIPSGGWMSSGQLTSREDRCPRGGCDACCLSSRVSDEEGHVSYPDASQKLTTTDASSASSFSKFQGKSGADWFDSGSGSWNVASILKGLFKIFCHILSLLCKLGQMKTVGKLMSKILTLWWMRSCGRGRSHLVDLTCWKIQYTNWLFKCDWNLKRRWFGFFVYKWGSCPRRNPHLLRTNLVLVGWDVFLLRPMAEREGEDGDDENDKRVT